MPYSSILRCYSDQGLWTFVTTKELGSWLKVNNLSSGGGGGSLNSQISFCSLISWTQEGHYLLSAVITETDGKHKHIHWGVAACHSLWVWLFIDFLHPHYSTVCSTPSRQSREHLPLSRLRPHLVSSNKQLDSKEHASTFLCRHWSWLLGCSWNSAWSKDLSIWQRMFQKCRECKPRGKGIRMKCRATELQVIKECKLWECSQD